MLMQFIADLGHLRLAWLPAAGAARYRAIGWLNFIATELHKTCSPLFSQLSPKNNVNRSFLSLRLDAIEHKFADRQLLMGAVTVLRISVCRDRLVWSFTDPD